MVVEDELMISVTVIQLPHSLCVRECDNYKYGHNNKHNNLNIKIIHNNELISVAHFCCDVAMAAFQFFPVA